MGRTTIVLYGHFGSGNIGNDSSFEAALTNLQRISPDCFVVCVCDGPEAIAQRFGVATVPIATLRPKAAQPHAARRNRLRLLGRATRVFAEAGSMLRSIAWFRRAKLFVIVGTGAVDDLAVHRPWDAPFDLLRWCLVARIGGAKVSFLSVGVGPIVHPVSRRLMLAALRLAHVRSYRETAAVTFLEGCGFDTTGDRIYPDLAFSLDMTQRLLLQTPRMSVVSPRVGVGVMAYRGWHPDPVTGEVIFQTYMGKIKAFVGWLLERGCTVRVVIGDTGDAPCVAELLAFVRSGPPAWSDAVVAEPMVDVDGLFAQIAQTDIVVATRFHNVLCSMLMEKPVLSLGYHEKNDLLMDAVGLGSYCQRIDDFQLALLKQHFNECIARREELVGGMRSRLAEFRGQLEEQYLSLFVSDDNTLRRPVKADSGTDARRSQPTSADSP
jgi:polysaccharide pyruvyl transferase WcaK-like protein